MSIKISLKAWAFLTLTGLLACSGSLERVSAGGPTEPEHGDPGAGEIPPGAVSVTIDPVQEATTQMSGIFESRRVVIRDAETWAAFWDELNGLVEPKPTLPPIDFASRMVIAATMGQKPSGGYVISVAEVAEDGGQLYAAVMESSPGPDCVVTTVITSPAAAVSVPRMDEEVVFVERAETVSCSGS